MDRSDLIDDETALLIDSNSRSNENREYKYKKPDSESCPNWEVLQPCFFITWPGKQNQLDELQKINSLAVIRQIIECIIHLIGPALFETSFFGTRSAKKT